MQIHGNIPRDNFGENFEFYVGRASREAQTATRSFRINSAFRMQKCDSSLSQLHNRDLPQNT
jgi:hypothetical protein